MNNILNKINFTYQKAFNQLDNFTKEHVKYDCIISKDNKHFNFTYQCNPNYSIITKMDCLYTILSDKNCYDESEDLDDFIINFGYNESYESSKIGKQAFYDCKKTSESLKQLFNQSELSELNEIFQDF